MKTWLPIAAFVLLVASCKKDPPLKTPPNVITRDTILIKDTFLLQPVLIPYYRAPWPMIKTITQVNGNGGSEVRTYEYDLQWRVTKIIYPTYTSTFNYSPAGDVVNGMPLHNGVVLRDQNGIEYSYNSNNNRTQAQQLHGYGTFTYNADYNMESSYSNGEAGSDRITWNYTYTYNNHLNTIGNYNTGEYFWGKSSVNLVERSDYSFFFSSSGPDTTGNNQHFVLNNYLYNDSGWVSHLESKNYTISKIFTDSVNYHIDTSVSIYNTDYTYY